MVDEITVIIFSDGQSELFFLPFIMHQNYTSAIGF